ncbi:hypothetical protein [Bdellovibrio sp. HCB337]|uniref:hypothetical protein n=1 Tax=Bdellovibrio sp. HCB337 TaxID=3394358 RepID=UPI0039A58672
MKLISILLFLVSSNSFASEKIIDACKQKMADLKQESGLAVLNITNNDTTRTPEGGPYQRKSLACDEQGCKVVSHKDFFISYEPGHKDANKHGYVTYPYISLDKEIQDLAKINYAYKALKSVCQL